MPREGSPLRVWRLILAALCQEGDPKHPCTAVLELRPETPPTLCRPEPGQSSASTACLMSDS